MERIKKALDLAREEREGQQRAIAMATTVDSEREQITAPNVETGIHYSKTKVIGANHKILQQNRILVTDEELDGRTAFKMLRTQVLQRMVAKGWNALAITSPAPGDGKTIVAANLAISLARELHHTVLLVDLDLRNPSLHKYFGLNLQHGIGDYLLSEAPLSDILVNPGIERLVILPGRNPIENSSELLASPQMGQLVKELKSRYPSRFVLFDLPPILSADDALAFAPYIDATLLVLREKKTSRQELEQAMDVLRDVTVLGTVLNASTERVSSYY